MAPASKRAAARRTAAAADLRYRRQRPLRRWPVDGPHRM